MNSSSTKLAKQLRLHALEMTHLGNSSHIGSILSICDILAVLYENILHIDPKNPKLENRDRFILSKGHAGAGVYAALAEKGFFDKEELKKHYSDGSLFSGHVSHKEIPGVELSTGSLGHGLSVACGSAFGAKLDNKSHRVFNLMSDGECDEGSNWEAIMFAAHNKLNRLIVTVDDNKQQIDGSTLDIMGFTDLGAKFESFGWNVAHMNGNNMDDILDTVKTVQAAAENIDKPTVIIMETEMGQGVDFMMGSHKWHGVAPNDEQLEQALAQLPETLGDY